MIVKKNKNQLLVSLVAICTIAIAVYYFGFRQTLPPAIEVIDYQQSSSTQSDSILNANDVKPFQPQIIAPSPEQLNKSELAENLKQLDKLVQESKSIAQTVNLTDTYANSVQSQQAVGKLISNLDIQLKNAGIENTLGVDTPPLSSTEPITSPPKNQKAFEIKERLKLIKQEIQATE